MKVSSATVLRANAVLFSVSTGIAAAACLSVGVLFGLLDEGIPELRWQGGTFLIASLVMLLLRWSARRAFDSAAEAHKIQLTEAAGPETSIASDCPHAWLDQLHLELHGHRCGD